MHELSIAQSILDTVEQQRAIHGGDRVVNIQLRVGELSAIVADALRFSFEILSKGTAAEGAIIDIEHIAWRVRCGACSQEYPVQDSFPCCPACQASGGPTVSGRELQIVELTIE